MLFIAVDVYKPLLSGSDTTPPIGRMREFTDAPEVIEGYDFLPLLLGFIESVTVSHKFFMIVVERQNALEKVLFDDDIRVRDHDQIAVRSHDSSVETIGRMVDTAPTQLQGAAVGVFFQIRLQVGPDCIEVLDPDKFMSIIGECLPC